MAILLFLLAIPIILLYLIPKYTSRNKTTLLPPGPRGLPLIGNLHQLDPTGSHIGLWKLSQKHGPLMSLRLGSIPTLVISSAKMAKEVMKTQDLAFCSRPSLLGQQKLSYNGLDLAFCPYNDYWREMRKISVIHLLSIKRVQSFRPIRELGVSKMISKISELSSSSKVINLSEMLIALTSTIICKVALGKSYEEDGAEKSRFHAMFNDAQAVMASFYFSDNFPALGWIDRLTGLRGLVERNFKEMDVFYQEIIDEHLDPNRPESMRGNIIDIFLELQKDKLCPFDLTTDHIKAMLMNIIIGGTDTTAVTVVWTMTELIRNPRVMKKLQEEIRNTVGNKGAVDEDDLHKLVYLKAVIKESMRLTPPLPLLVPRETIQTGHLGGYEIPPKTLIFVNAYAVGRDTEVWENPEEFNPERFVGNDIDLKGNDFELIPFGAGRRGCPGLNLGYLTVEIIVASLLFNFDWGLPAGMKKEDIDSEIIPGIAVHKKNPLCLVAKTYTNTN